MRIVPITPENALQYKAVRLRALRTDPTAFGSTYARESQLDDAGWIQRIREWVSRRAGYLAIDGEVPCGMIAVFPEEAEPLRAHVVSMWVAPEQRKNGVGRLLINAVKHWAAERGFRELRLMVTSVNKGAAEFYLRNGFFMTGMTGPYPNDPAIVEYEMALVLAQA